MGKELREGIHRRANPNGQQIQKNINSLIVRELYISTDKNNKSNKQNFWTGCREKSQINYR